MKRASFHQQPEYEKDVRTPVRILSPEVRDRQAVREFLDPLHRRIAEWTRLTVWLAARASRERIVGSPGDSTEREARALLKEVTRERADFVRQTEKARNSTINSRIDDADYALRSLIARLDVLIPSDR